VSGIGFIKQIISHGRTRAGSVPGDIFYALTAFRTKILTGKNRAAAIRAILYRRFFFPDQGIATPLAKAVFFAVNGMALRADSHNGLFLMINCANVLYFSNDYIEKTPTSIHRHYICI
jgi:hypothetical protein